MRLSIQWAIPIGAEMALMVAFLLFANASSWSGASTAWGLATILVVSTFVNERIWRWEERAARDRGKPWRRRGTVK
jgi:hypothetical protein